jgi:hypothetical protein
MQQGGISAGLRRSPCQRRRTLGAEAIVRAFPRTMSTDYSAIERQGEFNLACVACSRSRVSSVFRGCPKSPNFGCG